VPIYMNYDGVKGDVLEEGHKDWVELSSFQWGVGRGISSPTGRDADRESSAPSVSEITVTKAQDKSSSQLLNESLQGEGKTVKIDFCRTNKDKMDVYITFELTNTMISGFSASSGGDRPTESLSLNFTKIAATYTPSDPTNAGASPETVTYDLATAKVV
jgi:type VI secretion system secreted protein Hcp